MSIFDTFKGQQPQRTTGPNPFENVANTISGIQQFAKGMNGNTAESIGKSMLANGMMSQEQFNQLAPMADKFYKMMFRR